MAAGTRLTLADVSDICEGADVREIKKLDASKRGITRTVDLRRVVHCVLTQSVGANCDKSTASKSVQMHMNADASCMSSRLAA